MARWGSSSTSRAMASEIEGAGTSSGWITCRCEVRNRMTSSKSAPSQKPGVLGSIGLPWASGIRTINTVPSTVARGLTAGNGTPAGAFLQTCLSARLRPPRYRSQRGVRHAAYGLGRSPALSETPARTPIRQELDQLGAADDAGAGDEVVLVELALLETGRAHVNGAATLREVVHQLAQRRESFLVDRRRGALGRKPYALGAEKHHRLLAGAQRGVGEHEAHGGAVGVVRAVGEVHAEFPSHCSAFLSTNQVEGRLRRRQRVAREPAPRRQVFGRAGVMRDETQHLSGTHRLHASAERQQQDAAREVRGIPHGVGTFEIVRRLAHEISFASASSRGSTLSRPSDGSPKIARSTPAAASLSSPSRFGGAKKIDTGAVLGSRPACLSRSRSAGILSSGFWLGRMIGIQPSPNSTTRSNVVAPSPPMRIGGCGFCSGLGSAQILSKLTKSPWNFGSFLVQISFIASTRSRSRRQRDLNAVPWFSISSAFQPPPIPNSTRPPESRSSVATSLAMVIGSRSITRQMPVPSFRRFVAAPAAISATNGS